MTEPEDVWHRVEENERIARQYLSEHEPHYTKPHSGQSPTHRRYDDTEVINLTGWRRVRVIAALITAALGSIVVVLALLPGGPYLPDGIEFVPFAMVFPLFGWAVIERAKSQSARRRTQPRQKWYEVGMTSNEQAKRWWDRMLAQAHKYRVLLAIGIPVLILLWILTLISIVSIQGQPVHSGNTYYPDDHGSHIPVNKAGYEAAIAKQQTIFAAGGTMFLLVSIGMTVTFDPKQTSVPA
jgi:NADH:ubiquinone oxidoreductase subunit 3 (subunit A)